MGNVGRTWARISNEWIWFYGIPYFKRSRKFKRMRRVGSRMKGGEDEGHTLK